MKELVENSIDAGATSVGKENVEEFFSLKFNQWKYVKKFQIVLGKKVIVDVVFFSSNFFYIRFGLMLKIDHNMHWRIQVGNEPNPGGFLLIMFSHWVV